MGLFDSMPALDTPEGQGLLSAAFSLLSARKRPGERGIAGALGTAGHQYMQTRNQSQEMAQRRSLQDMQLKAGQLNLDQAQQARAREQEMMALRARFQTPQGFDYAGYAQALATHSPEQAFDWQQRLKPPTKGPIKVGAGESLINPDTFTPVYTAPNKPASQPAAIQEYEYAKAQGFKGTFEQWDTARKRAGATNVSLSNVTKQEGEESKAVGKFFGGSYADIQKAGFEAESKINRYSRLGQLLEGVNTGTFTPTGLEVAKAASALGLNIDPNMQNKEAAQALSSEIALQLRNPAGGAGMPGAMSDADRQFLANMVPGLATTPEGRKLMIETASKLAKRDKEVAAMARKYRQKNGNINEGFYDELARYSEANPLFKGGAGSGGGNPAVDDALKLYPPRK